jgi:excisionase family DNA binding protein
MAFNRLDLFGPIKRRGEEVRSKRAGYIKSLDKDLYTVPEAAKLMEIHPKTLYRWIREGERNAVQPSPRKTRVPAREIARYWYPGSTSLLGDEDDY